MDLREKLMVKNVLQLVGKIILSNFQLYAARFSNYGHDDFSIGLLRDTTPHVEIQLMIYGAMHPFLWP